MSTMIELSNVWYHVGGHSIFSGVNLQMQPGEFVYVLGPSGSGKSTLLRLIHMDLFPTRGKIKVAEYDSETILKKEIPMLRRKVGMIFQDFKLLEDRNVFENVAFALWVTGVQPRKIKKKVFEILTEVRLCHKRNAMVYELSGGEQQRVAIARALVNEPYVLLADEPTGNLDASSAEEVMDLLKQIHQKGTAVLMATHRLELISQFPGRVIRIEQEKLVS